MDRFLRGATPIVLLVLAALAWFGPWLPGHDALARSFGEGALLRFVTGLLCVYVALLVVERQRLEHAFKQLLGAFREFHEQSRGAIQAGEMPGARREAVEILVAALESSDDEVRRSALTHLRRLTGQDLGEDLAAWRRWLAAQPEPAAREG